MGDFYDALESRAPEQREEALLQALPAQIAHAQAHSPAMAQILRGVDAAAVNSRDALAHLPVTRKSELAEQQKAARAADAFGGFATIGWGARAAAGGGALRVFASPGGLYEPEGHGRDYWRVARALHAAGLRAGDLVHNAFSYHFTPAGAMMENGAHALGCTVFPAGIGQTEQQVQAMADLRPAAYAGTPSFLKILLDKADELGIALPSLTRASLGAEAFPPSLGRWLH